MIKTILSSKQFKYLIVGGCNTVVGYFTGIFLYFFLISKIDIVFISIISSIFSISFSFFTYKIFVFKTNGNWFKEYIKCYMVYGGISIINVFIIWLFVDIFNINIWFLLFFQSMIIFYIHLF